MLREGIYRIVRRADDGDTASKVYDVLIMLAAIVSMVPLMFKQSNEILDTIDVITVYVLFMDYIFHWATYDYLSRWKGPKAFVLYPFMPMSIINLVSLLPSMGLLGQAWRILRLLRIFKLFQYSKSLSYISSAFKKEWRTLSSVLIIAVGYIFVSALAMFVYEPDTFGNFFDALYWATTALTTVGYGDVYPVSEVGKLISMCSSLFGVAVIALPAGIITASFVEEINRDKEERQNKGEAVPQDESVLERIIEIDKKEVADENEH